MYQWNVKISRIYGQIVECQQLQSTNRAEEGQIINYSKRIKLSLPPNNKIK